MQRGSLERRKRRSADTRTALSFQLHHVLEQASLDALVLADDSGLIIAASGNIELCLELAAIAPMLDTRDFVPSGTQLDGKWIHVRTVNHQGEQLFVVSCSDSLTDVWSAQIEVWLAQTSTGVQRILAA